MKHWNSYSQISLGRLMALLGMICLLSPPVLAHHVLGRPAYSLNEDSNTPPSMTIETQIGSYFVSAMVYPAFPRPNENGRINFYATHLDTGLPLNTGVTFKVRNDSWFSKDEERLGAQVLDDNVYRQGFVFKKEGNYIITAEFEAEGELYTIDFPLRVGDPFPVGPLGTAVGVIILVLVSVSILQRRKLLSSKLRNAHDEMRS